MLLTVRRVIFLTLFVIGLASPLIAQSAFLRWGWAGAIEVGRITSPDWRYDAVIVHRNPTFASTRASTEVYVVPHGGKITTVDDRIMAATRAEEVRGVWRDDHLLEIRYSRARIDGFTAVWPTRSASAPSVEIRLIPPAAGSSFVPGEAS